ncbi:MAG: MBL fold metallo-hydrolase [Candidatus Asgardarchaeia archaeon]
MAITLEYYGGCAVRVIKDNFVIVLDPGVIDGEPLISSDLPAHAVLVTHIHDKNFGNSVEIVKKQKSLFFGNTEVVTRAQLDGAPSWRLHELENASPYELPFFTVTGFLVRHKPTEEPVTQHTSFLLKIGDISLVHLGHGVNVTPFEGKEIDVLLVAINSKEAFSPEDALNTLSAINAKLIVPMDYNEKELQYFSKNVRYFIPKTDYLSLSKGEKISIERHVTGELIVEKI